MSEKLLLTWGNKLIKTHLLQMMEKPRLNGLNGDCLGSYRWELQRVHPSVSGVAGYRPWLRSSGLLPLFHLGKLKPQQACLAEAGAKKTQLLPEMLFKAAREEETYSGFSPFLSFNGPLVPSLIDPGVWGTQPIWLRAQRTSCLKSHNRTRGVAQW